MKFDLDRLLIKLTSRKLWVAVFSMVFGALLTFRGGGDAETVWGLVLTFLSVVVYLISETAIDVTTANSISSAEAQRLAARVAEVLKLVVENLTFRDVSKAMAREPESEADEDADSQRTNNQEL